MFRAVIDANSPSAVTLGVIAALGSVVALFYYAGVARTMWFHDPAPEVHTGSRTIPAALTVAIGLCVVVTIVVGVYPQIFARIGELAFSI
jgi:NADH-quinone oxidoreductase subunit N